MPSYPQGTSLTPIPGIPVAPALPAKEANGKVTKATIVVTLPADAKLYFEGKQTTMSSNKRQFFSPELKPGIDYNYTVKCEIVRNGKAETKTETVSVRAGKVSKISFDFPMTAVAAK